MINLDDKDIIDERIIEEIDFEKLNELCQHLTDAVCNIFNSCGLYYRIFTRVKSPESIANKIINGHYGSKENPKKLQDLIGLRVVLYYYDDLSICRDIVEKTFQMIDTWSRNSFNINEFKATKINGVFRFPAEYFKLYTKPLWTLPIDTTFEIQFRTVFFEGWHEIEHDMRYKSLASDDQFWQNSEELSRILNCILANLELSDWSLVQLFEQLAYNHYKNKNWELMLKSHFRIKMDDSETLSPQIVTLFNKNKDIAKEFYKCTRQDLIWELLKLENPHITYDLIVRLLNERIVHNPEITEICDDMLIIHAGEHNFQKHTLAPLETSTLFQLDVPLMHRETRSIESEFNAACSIIFKWVRYKFTSIFPDFPSELCTLTMDSPGYKIDIDCRTQELSFDMKMMYIDSRSPGTIWYIEAHIKSTEQSNLVLTQKTYRNTPYGVAQRETFNKPSFISDLSIKIGLMDINRLGNKAKFIRTKEELSEFFALVDNPARKLPVILLTQHNLVENTEISDYKDGYDMNTFPINGTRLAKVVGLYSHVYMLDYTLVPLFADRQKYSVAAAAGCIQIFWKTSDHKEPELFTKDMIQATQFDFNRFAFHDQNVNEKAFRHKLVQIIKDDNTRN